MFLFFSPLCTSIILSGPTEVQKCLCPWKFRNKCFVSVPVSGVNRRQWNRRQHKVLTATWRSSGDFSQSSSIMQPHLDHHFLFITLFFFFYCISYRCGDHVLLSGGPLVARTGLCSQYEVTALHVLGPGPQGLRRRVQGLSLPLQLQVGASSVFWCKQPETMCNHLQIICCTWATSQKFGQTLSRNMFLFLQLSPMLIDSEDIKYMSKMDVIVQRRKACHAACEWWRRFPIET